MGDFWKLTADLFNGFIEKPKMSDKLLVRPPFKYIYDIVMETIKKTNCGNGTSSSMKDSTRHNNRMPSISRTRTRK
jgi:TRAF3-interacting protein 1